MNQLVRENNADSGKTYVYEYDSNGNILSKKTYLYTTGSLGSLLSTVTYTYGNDAWGDLLTNYNGTNIAYDEIGNPLNWHNVTSMTWTQGRRLTAYTYTKNGKTYNVTLEYNKDGIRTSKTTVNASNPSDFVIETYVVDGSSIIRESIIKSGSMITLYYLYDANGDVIGFNYGNSSTYFYGKNIQGDVVALFNSQNQLVARYYYDAWGNVISITDENGNEITSQTHIANVNPIRYRSYHFDSDTGFYYLNSRYYDSEVGRFINADVLLDNKFIVGYNLFAYCGNNFINCFDTDGRERAFFLPVEPPQLPKNVSNNVQHSIIAPPSPLSVEKNILEIIEDANDAYNLPSLSCTGKKTDGRYEVYCFSEVSNTRNSEGKYLTTLTTIDYYFAPNDKEKLNKKISFYGLFVPLFQNIVDLSNSGPIDDQRVGVIITIAGVLASFMIEYKESLEKRRNNGVYLHHIIERKYMNGEEYHKQWYQVQY